MASKRGRVFYIDRKLPVVGRVNKSLDTYDRNTADYREGIILRLSAQGRNDALQGLKEGRYSAAQLTAAYEEGPDAVRALVEWQGDPSVEDLIDDFVKAKATEIKTAERYKKSLDAIVRWRPGIRLSALANSETINQFRIDRHNSGVSNDGILRDLAAISQFLKWRGGKKMSRRAFDDVVWPRPSPRRTRRLSKAEIRSLLYAGWEAQQTGKYPYRDIYYVMLVTGLRPSEVCRIRIHDLDVERKILFVPDSKTARGVREIPVTDEVIRIIQEHAQPPIGKAFMLSEKTLSDAFRDHAKRAGISDVSLRDLRRTHAQYMRAVEGDVVKVRDQLGHVTVLHTEAYVGESDADERRDTVLAAVAEMGL